MPEAILILGASARAAAQSARRAGFAPVCGDLFADVDLLRCAAATAVAHFPSELLAVARAAPAADWMYTGGLENHPALVERIAAARPLRGNSAEVLRRVRDPFLVADALRRAGLDAPECRATAPKIEERGRRWIHKGKQSSGGSLVREWHGDECRMTGGEPQGARRAKRGWYFQQRMEGLPCSAVYVADGGTATLVGVTEQLLVSEGPSKGAFCYAGSVGPFPLSATCRKTFESIGLTLAHEFELIGLIGVDAVMSGDRVWPVEVNPRFPASIEVLEWALASGAATAALTVASETDHVDSAVGWHVAACRESRLPTVPDLVGTRWFGKRIHFARRDCAISAALIAWADSLNAPCRWPAVADIPVLGTRIRARHPVLTNLADGSSRNEVLERLAEAERQVAEML
jgi:predicted ATP-grasp superfamily ATP-dependent carboligase